MKSPKNKDDQLYMVENWLKIKIKNPRTVKNQWLRERGIKKQTFHDWEKKAEKLIYE
jgi:hypothetical protein